MIGTIFIFGDLADLRNGKSVRVFLRCFVEGKSDKMGSSNCDSCAYNVYDEEDECYYCEANMDEDDMVRMMEGQHKDCPYYRNGDEYAVVKKQI